MIYSYYLFTLNVDMVKFLLEVVYLLHCRKVLLIEENSILFSDISPSNSVQFLYTVNKQAVTTITVAIDSIHYTKTSRYAFSMYVRLDIG